MNRCNDCGHLRDNHEHYRAGTECGICSCPRYVPPIIGVWRQVLDWLNETVRRGK